jgi:phenylacetic acid degradation operon negative regulatory protein
MYHDFLGASVAMRTPDPPALAPSPHVRRWIRRELAAAPPRASSLIITVWGDAISPHGGAVMLAGLIELLAPFGINERLVRTSVFRLAREDWLAARPVGRESLYRLTHYGVRRFEQAYRRIYDVPFERWDESWEIVIADRVSADGRRELEQELGWEGFGALAPGVFVRPARAPSNVARIIAALGLARKVSVVRASDDATLGGRTLASGVPRAWDLEGVAAAYRRFIARFGGVIQRFRRSGDGAYDPAQSFIVRTLLIHEYRRVLLRDPQLPAALLPLDWPGAAAHALCGDFYRLTHRAAERHLLATLRTERGILPPATPGFYRRFGGLEP